MFSTRRITHFLCLTAALAACGGPFVSVSVAAESEATPSESVATPARVVVVLGAPGNDEYATTFRNWADAWRGAAKTGGADFTLIGGAGQVDQAAIAGEAAATTSSSPNDITRLRDVLAEYASQPDAEALWLVLIGHGTFDGDAAKFNLRGPDLAAAQLAEWLAPIKTPVALIDCASASAPFLKAAAAPGRVVITATKSGFEQNFARFGNYLGEAIGDEAADLDKDGQTSLLEAYLTACRGVVEFYESDQRLATEHALLDDNGDGLGTPADWFRGVRATKRAKEGAALDGLRAHQFHLVRSDRETDMSREARDRRDKLELSLASLRDKKVELGDEEYYQQLRSLLVELARLYEAATPVDSAE